MTQNNIFKAIGLPAIVAAAVYLTAFVKDNEFRTVDQAPTYNNVSGKTGDTLTVLTKIYTAKN